MKNFTFKTIQQIFLGIAVVASVGMVHADWGEPSAIPPLANIAPAIHTGNDQIKDGDLGIGTALSAVLNAAFKQETTLGGTLIGKVRSGANTVAFGGTGYDVDVLASGGISVDGTIAASNIANTSTKHLCADTTGKIVTCDDSGGNDECPPGQIHVYSGRCDYTVKIDSSGYTNAAITAVSGITGFTFNGPLKAGGIQQQNGLHTLINNGSITITATGPTNVPQPKLNVYENDDPNMYYIACYPLNPNETKTITTPTLTVLNVEVINISINFGGC